MNGAGAAPSRTSARRWRGATPGGQYDWPVLSPRCPSADGRCCRSRRRCWRRGRVWNQRGALSGKSKMSQHDVELKELIAAGRKIDASRLYRDRYGVGLKKAKDAVEAIERGE